MIQTWTFTKALLKLEPDVIIFAVLTNFTAFFSEKKAFYILDSHSSVMGHCGQSLARLITYTKPTFYAETSYMNCTCGQAGLTYNPTIEL